MVLNNLSFCKGICEMPEMTKDEQKEIVKEALREWLDQQFATFGRWSLNAILALLLAGVVWAWLWGNGWHKGGVM